MQTAKVVPEGVAPSVAALRRVLDDVRPGDPLAPVDVVVPSGVAGVSVRRAVAGGRGLAGVRFGSLPQLAERLAARHLALEGPRPRRPLTRSARSHALRRAVADAAADPGDPAYPLASAARHRATAALLDGLMAELDAATLRSTPATLTPRGSQVLALHARYRAVLDARDVPSADLARAAVAALAAGQAPRTHVVLFGTHRLTSAEHDLLDALDAGGLLTRVEASPRTPEVHLTVAPDADEEVRLVVRRVLAHLAAHPTRPERVAVAYRSPVPYARLLAEHLTVAGLAHHVPSGRTLAQTLAGRTLLGLLDLHARSYPRAEVVRWMSDAPVVDADGRRLPVVRFDRLSREAGVSRGPAVWAERLERTIADAERHLDALLAVAAPPAAATTTGDPTDDERRARHERDAADARALLTQVGELAAAADQVLSARSWPAAAEAAAAALTRCLGPRRTVDAWSARADPTLATAAGVEQQAHDAVLASVAGLGGLEGAPTPGSVLDALRDELDRSVPSGSTLGRGVLVARVEQLADADVDLLLVVGMTEDSFPPRAREHAVLRDADRCALSADLATVDSRRHDQRARWLAALAGATRVELSYPRADTRSQRRQFASPWFLEQAALLAGAPVGAGEVESCVAPWLTTYDSFVQSLQRAETPASGHELDVALAMAGHVDRLAADDPRLARGLAASRARASGRFDAWSGHTGELPEPVRARVDRGMSATTLQDWATCPTSHFLGRVLRVRELEDLAADDTIDARVRGSLVHRVLEEFFGEHLGSLEAPGRPPGEAWTRAEVEHAHALLTEHAAELTASGRTGRDVLWQAQLSRLHRAVTKVLAVDSALRLRRGTWPVLVEADFGRAGVEPLVVQLPGQGPVTFAGSVDRIDADADGSLVVTDYKTGGDGYGWEAIPTTAKPVADADLVDRGRKLQLVLYSLAARQLLDRPDAAVTGYYWFVEHGTLQRGGPVDDRQTRRLHDVLDVVVGGIRSGVYPANPGEETWASGRRQTWTGCRYCPFDRVCPTTRAERWQQLRLDPAVAPYTAVADPDPDPAPDPASSEVTR